MAIGNLSNPRIIAAGNILEFDVDAGSWSNDIDVTPESFTISGTSPGYTGDVLGSTSRSYRTGLRATHNAGVLSVYMADSVYVGDTVLTVEVLAGAIDDGTDSNAALGNTAVTNNSTLDYPDYPVRHLGAAISETELVPQFGVVGTDMFYVEADAYAIHKLASVRFTLTGNGGSPVVNHVVTSRTRSKFRDSVIISSQQWTDNGNGGLGVFSTPAIDPATFPDGPITVQVEAFGVYDNGSTTFVDECWFLNNNGGTYTEVEKWADIVNGDDTTGDGTELNPFQTWEKAMEQAATTANPGISDPNLVIPTVFLKEGTYALARVGIPYADNLTWATTKSDPAADPDLVVVRSNLSTGEIPRMRFTKFDCSIDVSDGSDGSNVFIQNNTALYPNASKPAHICFGPNAKIHHQLGRDGQISGSTRKIWGANYQSNSKIIIQSATITEMYQVGINADQDQTYARNVLLTNVSNDFNRNVKSVFGCKAVSNRVSDGRSRITSLSGTPLVGDTMTGDNGVDPVVTATVTDVRTSGGDTFVFIDTSGGDTIWDFKKFDNSDPVTFSPSGASGTLLFDHPDGTQYTGGLQIGIVSNYLLYDCDGQSFFVERGSNSLMIYNYHAVNTNGTATFNAQIGDSSVLYNHKNDVCDYVTLASQQMRMREGGNPVTDFAFRNSVAKAMLGWEQPGVLFENVHQYSTSVFGQLPLDRSTEGSGDFVNGTGQDEDYDPSRLDFRPTENSVLRNQIPAGEQLLEFDIFGVARPDDGTGAIGAFEFVVVTPPSSGGPSTFMTLVDLARSNGFGGTDNDAVMAYLGSLGHTGSLPDRIFSFLGSKGLDGSLPDRFFYWDGT